MRAASVFPERRPNPLWKALAVCAAMLGLSPVALSQSNRDVEIPDHGDTYSRLVRQLETGTTSIDYRAFRESFLASPQFKVAADQAAELKALRAKMRFLMEDLSSEEIVEVAKKMLGIDYTDMEAHKILQQTYQILGDARNQKKYHDIEFGLLNSIVRSGDGKTCRTGWSVLQVAEQSFILDMLGARLVKQTLEGGRCDRMEVDTDQGRRTYYFEVSRVFKGNDKRGTQ